MIVKKFEKDAKHLSKIIHREGEMVRSSSRLISYTNNNLLVTTYRKLGVVDFPSIHSIFIPNTKSTFPVNNKKIHSAEIRAL